MEEQKREARGGDDVMCTVLCCMYLSRTHWITIWTLSKLLGLQCPANIIH